MAITKQQFIERARARSERHGDYWDWLAELKDGKQRPPKCRDIASRFQKVSRVLCGSAGRRRERRSRHTHPSGADCLPPAKRPRATPTASPRTGVAT